MCGDKTLLSSVQKPWWLKCLRNNRSIVVIHSPAAVEVSPFESKAASILCMGYPGQEDGNAFAELLFGEALPHGRLATTWPVSMSQLAFTKEQYPGVLTHDPCINECKRGIPFPYTQATYSEGMLFGYRWYVETNIVPQYPFGHGLTYTSFSYSDFHIDEQNKRFTVKISNQGGYVGSEVAQLYVGYPEEYNQPKMQLKGFVRTRNLNPGESETVFLEIPELLYWKVGSPSREARAVGVFTAFVGASATDIRGTLQFPIE